MQKRLPVGWIVAVVALLLVALAVPSLAHTWNEAQFANRPEYAYPLPHDHDDLIGSLTVYTLQPGDTLLDVGRWYGLSANEVSDANGHLDWWSPPAGKQIILPTEHILPQANHVGIVMNIPEMRLYYFYPSGPPVRVRHRGKITKASYSTATPTMVYTYPVGLGRFDWKTPVGAWHITAKVKDPTWVVPEDIYEEHLERDGEAEHVVPGGEDDNPLGHYKLDLSIPEYGLHGTDVPWGVGMNVSHGCVRLYPEDIKSLFFKTRVGTPGRFVYQPIKFGWRGDALYVEVHDDLYAVYPGLWSHALQEVKSRHLENQVDLDKLAKAVEARSGIPTYVMPGPDAHSALESASVLPPVSAPSPSLLPTSISALFDHHDGSTSATAAMPDAVPSPAPNFEMPEAMPSHAPDNDDVE